MYVFLITNRCCHNVFQKDNINTYFQPEMYTSLHDPFSNMDCWSLIFPPDPCKLMSLCDFMLAFSMLAFSMLAFEFEPLFTYLSGHLKLLFCEFPIHILGLIFCYGVHPCFIDLFCKSSWYIIAINPLISGLPALPCYPV